MLKIQKSTTKNLFCVIRAKKSNNCCFIVSNEERIVATSYLANMEARFEWFKKDNSKLTCLVTRVTSFMEVKSGGGFSWWDELGKVTSDVNPATTFLQQPNGSSLNFQRNSQFFQTDVFFLHAKIKFLNLFRQSFPEKF